MIAVRFLLLSLLLLPADSAFACGWWGDSEMTSRREAAVTTADGRPMEQSLSLKSMKLPGEMGYGIAAPEPGRAMPYLLATSGQPVTRIAELKIFGFRSVIDLGTPAQEALLHRAESEDVGMRYFNIPVGSTLPNQNHIDLFAETLLDPENIPLLVYAHDAEMIAAMWASYRLKMGSPLEFSIHEARAMGLTEKQEAKLRNN